MEIYVVQPGDSIDSIAERFGVPADRLQIDNGIYNPNRLVTGQAIIIAYPKQTYTIQPGDTLQSIADKFNIPLMQLLRNNSHLFDQEVISPGETIVISYNTKRSITTNGFTFPYINRNTLYKSLPSLTYLSIFNYRISEKADIVAYYDDTEVIEISKAYGTIPLLLISILTLKGEPDIETAYRTLLSSENQEKIINQLVIITKAKGYLGINWVINILDSSNQTLISHFMQRISERLRKEGLLVFATINYSEQLMNENIDYSPFNTYTDNITFIKLIWGVNTAPPAPVSDINNIKAIINNASGNIPMEKIIVGKPTIGYDWQLPYTPNSTVAVSLNYNTVLQLADNVNVTIQFDEVSQTPYFYYNETEIGFPSEHIVWFIDARSINALLELVYESNLSGSGIWNIMVYNPQLWLPINSQYDIIKLI